MTNTRAERLALPAAVAVAAWWFLLHGAGLPPRMSDMPAMSGMPAMSENAAFPALAVMWVAMMAAMMLLGAAFLGWRAGA